MIEYTQYIFHYEREGKHGVMLKTIVAESLPQAHEVFEMRVKGKVKIIKVDEIRGEYSDRLDY